MNQTRAKVQRPAGGATQRRGAAGEYSGWQSSCPVVWRSDAADNGLTHRPVQADHRHGATDDLVLVHFLPHRAGVCHCRDGEALHAGTRCLPLVGVNRTFIGESPLAALCVAGGMPMVRPDRPIWAVLSVSGRSAARSTVNS
jgi:hypothetical protein